MPSVPSNAQRYFRSAVYTELPMGLRRPHHLRWDTWSRFYVLRGRLAFVDDDRHQLFELDCGHFFDVPPSVEHHVEMRAKDCLFSMDLDHHYDFGVPEALQLSDWEDDGGSVK